MKAISIGSRYEIYDDTLKAYDGLPAQTYTVCFSQMTGFFPEGASGPCGQGTGLWRSPGKSGESAPVLQGIPTEPGRDPERR